MKQLKKQFLRLGAVSISAKLCAILVRKQSQKVFDLNNFQFRFHDLIFTQSLSKTLSKKPETFVFSQILNLLNTNVLRIGERCGTASRVRSAKIKFSRDKQAKSQQNQAMALSKG